MIKERKRSGIQRRYLQYTIFLLVIALLMSSVGVWFYMRENLSGAIIDKYEFMDEKMGLALDNLYKKTDEATAACIVDDALQKSLQAEPLNENEQIALSKYFAYIDLDLVSEYCYVDNKGNVYTRSYSSLSYQTFEQSGFAQKLGGEYAKTKWIWAEDTLFGTDEMTLFVGRYVRSMDYAHEPGMLFLKMDDSFFDEILGEGAGVDKDIIAGIIDGQGELCTSWFPQDYHMDQKNVDLLKSLAASDERGMLLGGSQVEGGVMSVYRQPESNLAVFTYVPDKVLNQGLTRILLVMAGIYLVVILIAVNLSIYFSLRFTRPIQEITRAMTSFDGNDFSQTIELETHTELDQIGHSYNEMLGNIQQLLEEIKDQQKELRTSELNMLISQINPHFLYNTLDTIYMLARINKEETTMKMIQALSKYLRLSLSKGSDMVTVQDELENVKSYMEIQQIRNKDLFQYTIDCKVEAADTWILKLILQPLVENAVKYGFCDIFEGGQIRITVEKEEDQLAFCVFNNGKAMEAETVEKLNSLSRMPLTEMKECFPDRKHGYGLVNIITRLRLKYGERVAFYYERGPEGTTCFIKVPKDGKEYE